MAETALTDSQANALHGTTDSLTGFPYHSPGDAAYFTVGQRQRELTQRLLKTLANKLRVYQDGALTYGVRPGTVDDGSTTYSYAGSTGNALTDDDTNYIYLYVSSGALTLAKNTTGFPDPATTPHIPLAVIVVADSDYDYTDITDYRCAAVFNLESGADADDLNMLTDGSNADALHIHAASGLASAVQDLIPTVTVVGTDQTDGTADIAIQVKDAAGNSLAQRFRVRTWLADSDFGVPAAADTSFAVTGDTVELAEYVSEADYDVITPATGLATLTLTSADGTYYVMADVDGRIYSGEVTITGN